MPKATIYKALLVPRYCVLASIGYNSELGLNQAFVSATVTASSNLFFSVTCLFSIPLSVMRSFKNLGLQETETQTTHLQMAGLV